MRRLIAMAAVLASALIALAPDSETASGERADSSDPRLSGFGSCKALNRYAGNHPRALRSLSWGRMGGFALQDTAGGKSAPSAPTTSTPGTNVQEAGVDEPDIVKLDGETMLALAKGQLHAVDLSGPDPTLADSIEVPGISDYSFHGGAELLISGDRALVIGESSGPILFEASDVKVAPYSAKSTITELDIADPENLRITNVMKVEGSYVSSRLTGSTARVVVSAVPDYPAGRQGDDHGAAASGRSNRAIPSRGPRWLPTAVIKNRASDRVRARPIASCTDVSRPESFSGLDTLNVLTIDLARGLPAVDTDAIATSGETVYGSPGSLYVATERWSDGSNSPERLSDVSTEIHRFATSDPQTTDYSGSGEVPGYMLSQWSMSEHDGVLRVASTTSPPWDDNAPSAKSQSFVTSLAAGGGNLEQIGQLGGLGTDEQIYAVRFIGETGFVVTFRQIDPLYTLDLSNPAEPTVLGELKIPGYSAYLHPVGDGLLLGVGQAATDEGRTLGTQLSLFDVSDLADPRLIEQHRVGRHAYSEIEYDHHAFLFHEPTGLAMIPVEQYDYDRGGTLFSGAVGFDVGPQGIEETGRISHEAGRYSPVIRRSFVAAGRLFTVSERGVVAANLADLAPESELRFPPPPSAG